MSYQGPPPNKFRATVLGGPAQTPLIATKRGRRSASGEGLEAVPVSRTEARRGNHRAGDRHRLTEEQAQIRFRGKKHVVELVNLSRGGAMVEGPVKAKLWDQLELVLGQSDAVECIVRWVRGNRLGLEFAHETRIECDPETMDAMLCEVIRTSFPEHEDQIGVQPEAAAGPVEPRPGAQPRAAVRHPLIWSGFLHHDYEWEPVRLRNISTTGALVECAAELPKDATVYLELAGGKRLAATVRWSCGAQTGLAFREPFDIHQLAQAKPEIASAEWAIPDYLKDEGGHGAVRAAPWKRVTIEELSRSLGG